MTAASRAGTLATVAALGSRFLASMTLCTAVLTSVPAAAAPEGETFTAYEQETVDLALERHAAKRDNDPEGKRIVAIDIDVLDVFEDRDPMFGFVNIFHANTKDYVIRRELLFSKGNRYNTKKVLESARNIRSIRQESLVLIVPIATDTPGEVRVLVLAKDIWSLRLNSNYRIQNGQLELLLLQPAEENLGGTHRRLLGNFVYEPDTITVGGAFNDPRLAGTRHTWNVGANVILNHSSGDVEGGSGSFAFGRPLFSLSTPWSWGANTTFSRSITRRFTGLAPLLFDAEITPEDDRIPWTYDSEVLGGSVSVTRSLGYKVKNNFRLGMAVRRSVFRARPDALVGIDPAAVDEFKRDVVPFGETRNGPFAVYNMFFNDFLSITDAETMGLQENYLLGPQLIVRFQPIARAFGSTRNILNYTATAAYTQQLGKGYARVYGSADVETELRDADTRVSDSTLHTGLRAVSPPFFFGRLVYDGTWVVRPQNFTNSTISVGGDTRLRGYPSLAFIGENLFASNIEFRSRSFLLWSMLVRGALFYDVADAFMGDDIDPKQGAGFGFRVLFPQLGRAVVRVDWGFPLSPDAGPFNPFQGLLLTFRQAFGVPSAGSQGVSIGVN